MSNTHVLERRFFPKNKMIVREGDEAYVAFIIQSGAVSVYSEKDGNKIEFSKLNAGDIFGEMALISDQPRSASVEATEDCNLIVITRDVFQSKVSKSDPTVQAVVQMLSKRLTSSNVEIMKTKGVNIDNFISLLNQIFRDLLSAMDDKDAQVFKEEAFPVMHALINVVDKYRNKF